jgi:hypothetical protein
MRRGNFFDWLWNQGDQIGRILAHWMIVYFGNSFENYRSRSIFWQLFSEGGNYALILTKDGLGYILGYFSQTHLVTLFCTMLQGIAVRYLGARNIEILLLHRNVTLHRNLTVYRTRMSCKNVWRKKRVQISRS